MYLLRLPRASNKYGRSMLRLITVPRDPKFYGKEKEESRKEKEAPITCFYQRSPFSGYNISTLVEILVSKEKPFALGRRFFSMKFVNFVLLSAHVFAQKSIRKCARSAP